MTGRLILIVCLLALTGLVAPQHDDHDHADGEEPFHEVLELLGAEENSTILTTAQTEELVRRLKARVQCTEQDLGQGVTCDTCLTATQLIETATGSNSATTLDEEAFHKASVILVRYLTDLATVCKNITDPSAKGLSSFEDDLLQYTHSYRDDRLGDHSFEHILEDIGVNYQVENWGKCFSTESVFAELNITNSSGGATREQLGEVAAIVVASVLQGLCIGEAALPEKTFFINHLFELLNATNAVITAEAFEGMFESLGIGGGAHEEEGHEGHDHRRRRAAVNSRMKRAVSKSRVKRQEEDHDDHGHEEGDYEETCFTPDQLMKLYLIEEASGLTQAQFTEIAPAIVQQVYSKACVETTETTTTSRVLTEAEKYGYGTLAVIVISLLALIGVLFIPMFSSSLYTEVLQGCIALGVGALSADALLHLIPQALGLHEDHTAVDAHNHGEEVHDLSYIWKNLAVLGGIYLFFIFEKAMGHITSRFGYNHGHSHGDHMHTNQVSDDGTTEPPPHVCELRSGHRIPLEPANHHAMDGVKPGGTGLEKSVSKQQLTNGESTVTLDVDSAQPEADNQDKKKYVCCKGFTSLALLIILGDGMHNLSDGLAIGIAFAGNLSIGMSTAIAVLAHELPHEIGDFAILLKCGMSYKQALLWNFISAMSCFLGLYIGLAIGADITSRQWIFAVIAGMFLYIALVDMMPELATHKSTRPVVTFLVQNVGFMLGVTSLLLLALYEDQIKIGFQ
ncbi:zinc transporter ZIP12-like isoform X2 [Branchiostoma lanceolatum]|uniref:zinc transporter ZIP12-like isoform X2 n=1 Tax=Branchiostoma lanceolatum TaxID=7740 RepID=UPI0034573887